MSRRRQTDNRNRTRTRNRRKTKTKTKRDFTIHVSQHEKDLIESLRTIEDLEDFNAHHFGNEFVDAKLRNYGKNFVHNYQNIFTDSKFRKDTKFHKEYLDKDGNLVIEDNNGTRVIQSPKIGNSNSNFREFQEKMRRNEIPQTYIKRVEDDGKVRKIYINENGKETVYEEPSKFKKIVNGMGGNEMNDNRSFFNNQSSFKSHKTDKSSSYSREEHNDGETLTITEIIDGEKRVSTKPSKLKQKRNLKKPQKKYSTKRHRPHRRRRR